jgi:LuxR family maltose regulon positive regulatory protein
MDRGIKMTAITYQTRSEEANNFFTDIQKRQTFREYFMEEVLSNFTPELQDFVIKTSLLTEFSSDLCDYLFASDNSQNFIDQIYENNLFIESIDNENTWFRYHPLFVLSLNHQLQKRDPASIINIHKKALTWFIEKGYPEKAIIHALQSGHEEKAAEIIDSLALQAAIDFDLIKLVHWINAIPENLTNFRPRLGIYNALACFLLGQYDITNTRLQQVEKVLLNSTLRQDDPIEYNDLEWEIAVIRTGIEIMAGDTEKGYREISSLLNDKSKEKNYIYAMFTHFRARCLEKLGRLAEAINVYETACQYGLVRNYHIGHFHSHVGITQVLLRQGKIIKAKQECERIIEFLVEKKLESATYNMALSLQLEIELQLNNMDKAEKLADIVLANFENTISSESVLYNHVERCVYLANYLIKKKDLINARLYFDRALSCHREYSLQTVALPGVIIDTFIRLLRAEACENETFDWHQKAVEFLDEASLSTPAGKIAMATIWFNQKAFMKVEKTLAELINELRQSEDKAYLLQALIIYALVLFQTEDKKNAYIFLEETLEIATESGAMRVYIEQGEPLQLIIEAFRKTTGGASFEVHNPGFLEKLVKILDRECKHKVKNLAQGEPMMTALHLLKEPLSDRELEIANMLIAGKTGKEISDLLMISINTTKTHIQSIYRKFGIHSQKMLINKTKDLGSVQ